MDFPSFNPIFPPKMLQTLPVIPPPHKHESKGIKYPKTAGKLGFVAKIKPWEAEIPTWNVGMGKEKIHKKWSKFLNNEKFHWDFPRKKKHLGQDPLAN